MDLLLRIGKQLICTSQSPKIFCAPDLYNRCRNLVKTSHLKAQKKSINTSSGVWFMEFDWP